MNLDLEKHITYAHHHYRLLIKNRSWILTIQKDRILRKKPLTKHFWPSKSGLRIYQPRVIMVHIWYIGTEPAFVSEMAFSKRAWQPYRLSPTHDILAICHGDESPQFTKIGKLLFGAPMMRLSLRLRSPWNTQSKVSMLKLLREHTLWNLMFQF